MSRYWTDLVRGLTPYVPGEQPRAGGLVKLNTNENPYPPSPKALAVLGGDIGPTLRRYPDPSATALRKAVARRHGLAAEQVFAGNGSDEVLALCFLAFFKGRGRLRYPDISYSFYPVWSQLFETPSEQIPLAADFSLDLHAYTRTPGCILLPNPNAPTGMAVARDAIEACLKDTPDHVVVIDEAYAEFGAECAVPLIQRYPNLLVVQTLSKSHALAGLRVGFALGSPELIAGLDRVKSSFNSYPIDRVAERVAIAALDDEEYFAACRDRIVATREWTVKQLDGLGFSVLPSCANFVFARHPRVGAAALYSELRQREILVRHFDLPRIHEHLRISIGTDEEMQLLIASLEGLLGGR
jgi:histidinol-phosphate aminotransferase